MRLVDLIYKSKGGWLLELSDNKLFDNNLASELVEYSSFSNYNNQLSIVSFSTSSDNCLVVVKTAWETQKANTYTIAEFFGR